MFKDGQLDGIADLYKPQATFCLSIGAHSKMVSLKESMEFTAIPMVVSMKVAGSKAKSWPRNFSIEKWHSGL